MRLPGICLRNLASRPLRSALTAFGIAVAVACFIALVGLSRGLEATWMASFTHRGTHLVAVRKGGVALMATSVDESLIRELGEVEGVAAVAGELINVVTVEGERDHPIVATGWSRGSYLWDTLSLSAGSLPRPDQPHGVVLGEITAKELGLEVDDTLRTHGREFVVTGISKFAGSLSRSSMILHLASLQEMMERPGKVNMLNIRVRAPDAPERLEATKAELARRFPDLLVSELGEVAENNRFLMLIRATAWTVSTIALFMGMVVTLNTLLMSVAERTYDIGVLTAIGWQGGRILAMILIEGILLALLGSVLGSFVGVTGSTLLAGLPRVREFLTPELSPRLVLEASGAAVAMGIVGSLYPAWRAVRLNPVDALRHE